MLGRWRVNYNIIFLKITSIKGVVKTEFNNKNVEENCPMNKNIGKILIDKNFFIKTADESAYHFLGAFSIYPITRSIHKDDIQKFNDKIRLLQFGKTDYAIIRLKHTTILDETYSEYKYSDYIFVMITMKKSYAEISDDYFIELNVYNILNLISSAQNVEYLNTKYMTLLSFYDTTFFEYNEKNKLMEIYKFKDASKILISSSNIDKWISDSLSLYGDNIDKNFNHLVNDIQSFSNDFFYVLKDSPILNKSSICDIHIKGCTKKDYYGTKIVIGVMEDASLSDESDFEFLANKSNLDSLTGLINKKATKELIIDKISLQKNETFAMVMVDIDYFKELNDNYGHMFGDEVLIEVSDILKTTVKDCGFVGRIGGDEFLLILEGTNNEADVRAVLKTIRSRIEWAYSGHIKITTSLGCACYPKDAKTYDELFKLADKCLYIAKEKGRNRFILYDEKKHGHLTKVQLSTNAISILPKVSVRKKCTHICEIISSVAYQNYSLDKIMDSLNDYYEFDKSAIFLENKIYSHNFTKDDDEIYNIIDTYKNIFNENNILSINHYISVEKSAPQLFKYMLETKSFSLLQHIIYDKDNHVQGLIIFSTYNRTNKWSENDINYLTIICKLIEQILLNQAFLISN